MRIVIVFTCACLVTQSYLTLCDPMDCRPPASSVHKNTGGGFHAFVQGSSWSRNQIWVSWISCIAGRLFTTESPGKPKVSHCYYGLTLRASFMCSVASTRPLCPWNFPCKNPGMELPFLSLGSLPNPGIEFMCPALAPRFFTIDPLGKPNSGSYNSKYWEQWEIWGA